MLTGRELWRLSDAIKQLHAQTTLHQLVWTTCASVQELIECDWASVSLASPRFTRPTRFWSPYSTAQDRTTSAFAAFYHQHPNWRAFWERLRPDACQLLDVASPCEVSSLPIYHEVLKPLGIENLLGVTMPGSSMFAVGAIRDRQRRFTERDAVVLEVLADHLAAAARALHAATASAGARASDAPDTAGRVEFVALDPSHRMVAWSPGAASTFKRYFGSVGMEELPGAVRAWLVEQPSDPVLCVASGHGTLEIRRFDPHVRPGCCLVLYEQELSDGWPMPLELTPREAEIVRWVVAGKTNLEIGGVLAISARTVQKHLENVYAKLGVPTRTALVRAVLERAAR